jgi:hypothetical protein
METLTHWKKNNDSRYISGEDLKAELKGLKKEMSVVISKFEDSETFDMNSQKKLTRTGFWLSEYPSGTPLYKPVILNNTNANFCEKEFGSEYMEHWLNKPLVLYALADKRHGHVARFKKYYAPQISDVNALATLNKSKTLDELKSNWELLTPTEKNLATALALKDKLKTTLK